MRVEPYAVGSYLHVIKRGARGMDITQDEFDRRRFLRILYFMNDEYYDENWEQIISKKEFGYRPEEWPDRKSLVSVCGYTLMPNHFHLILRENKQHGISTFMQKLGQSMTVHFNQKYDQMGSIFQGSFRSRTIMDDTYLRYLFAYVLVKNPMELYPKGGLTSAVVDFENAWSWAIQYPFSNLSSFCEKSPNPITDLQAINHVYDSQQTFKKYAKDVIEGGKWTQAAFE